MPQFDKLAASPVGRYGTELTFSYQEGGPSEVMTLPIGLIHEAIKGYLAKCREGSATPVATDDANQAHHAFLAETDNERIGY